MDSQSQTDILRLFFSVWKNADVTCRPLFSVWKNTDVTWFTGFYFQSWANVVHTHMELMTVHLKHPDVICCIARSWYYTNCMHMQLLRLSAWIPWCWGTKNIGVIVRGSQISSHLYSVSFGTGYCFSGKLNCLPVFKESRYLPPFLPSLPFS